VPVIQSRACSILQAFELGGSPTALEPSVTLSSRLPARKQTSSSIFGISGQELEWGMHVLVEIKSPETDRKLLERAGMRGPEDRGYECGRKGERIALGPCIVIRNRIELRDEGEFVTLRALDQFGVHVAYRRIINLTTEPGQRERKSETRDGVNYFTIDWFCLILQSLRSVQTTRARTHDTQSGGIASCSGVSKGGE